jgi:predicted TIM-barrel fold metal-dependent hydrolase
MDPVIDVHHHFHSPRYVARHGEAHRRAVPAYAHVIDLTPADSVRAMDEAGVDAAMLSFPGVWYPDDLPEGRDSARDLNDFAAEARATHPGRFGALAALPLPDTDGTLHEIHRAYAELAVDGVGISSNYDGRHLGDSGFAPVFAELDTRSAVVYVHAAMAPGGAVPGLPPHAMELPFDTARTIADLILHDAFERWPSITWIFSHGAGALPMVAHRLGVFADAAGGREPGTAVGVIRDRVWVDTASVGNAPAMAAIRALLPDDAILFGSDFPYVPPARERAELHGLELQTEDQILGNGARLFPGVAATPRRS